MADQVDLLLSMIAAVILILYAVQALQVGRRSGGAFIESPCKTCAHPNQQIADLARTLLCQP